MIKFFKSLICFNNQSKKIEMDEKKVDSTKEDIKSDINSDTEIETEEITEEETEEEIVEQETIEELEQLPNS